MAYGMIPFAALFSAVPHPPLRGRRRRRARGGQPAAAGVRVALSRRRCPPGARRAHAGAARAAGRRRPRALPLLRGLHAAVPSPLPRPRGRHRRRGAPPGEPLLGGGARALRHRRSRALDAAPAALGAHLAARGGADRAGAAARPRRALEPERGGGRGARPRQRLGAPLPAGPDRDSCGRGLPIDRRGLASRRSRSPRPPRRRER